MSQSNYKGIVQEKLAKFKGLGKAEFNTSQAGKMVMFNSVLVAIFQYNDQTKQLTTQSSGSYPSKKEAEQSAAREMLATEDFHRYCDYTTWLKITPGNVAAKNGTQSFTNPKGTLLEFISKMARRPHIEFDTTPQGPFTCRVTVLPIHQIDEPIIATSGPCPAKKEAEQQASERMLNNSRFRGMVGGGFLPSEAAENSPPEISNTAEVSEQSIATVSSLTSNTPTPYGGTGTPVSSTSNQNYKGMLLEKMAKVGGGVTFDCKSGVRGFWSTVIAQHLKYSTVFESRSSGEYSSKKEADQSAAQAMLQDPAFALWLKDGTATTSGAAATTTNNNPLTINTRGQPPLETSSTLSSVVSTNSNSNSNSMLSSSTAPHLNPKGILYERAVKMLPQPQLTYITSPSEPFVCTLTATFPTSDANSPETGSVITTQGGPCKTKKAAEQEAASMMLSYPQFLTLGGSSSINANDSTVRCVKCNNILGNLVDFCFYVKSETEVQFMLKPEVTKLLTQGTVPSAPDALPLPNITYASNLAVGMEMSQRVGVFCGHCRACVGAHLSFGPDGAALTAFKNTDVRLKGAAFPSSRSWRTVASEEAFIDVEQRTPRNFFGIEDTSLERPECDLTPVVHPVMLEGQHTDSPDYQYTDLLDSGCGKVPREEQVAALHVCLAHHAIVVFPTGFGKTLVASMVMHRFHLLNPRKLVVMVEERVTLVQQQSSVIIRDTGMATTSISGNNSTKYVLSELLSGKYNALVITAGVLHNYLEQGSLRVSDFSLIVFDECHHTGNEHLYMKIIKKVAKCPEPLRPRVMGLTASPLKASKMDDAYKELEQLRESFLGATVYRPKVNIDVKDIVRHVVQLSDEQASLQSSLVAQLQVEVNKLQKFLKRDHMEEYKELVGKRPIVLKTDGYPVEWKRVEGCSAAAHYRNKEAQAVELAKKCRALVRALNDNYRLGPTFVHRQGADAAAALEETHVSGQVRALLDLLTERGADSCTLVFVETRYCANTVLAFLQSKYPALNCRHVVGQGGDDGMLWKQQEKVLVDFRKGDCKLVVCTTVLEEGVFVFAVAECIAIHLLHIYLCY